MAEIVPTINQQIQRIPQGEQFKPTHKVLKRIVPKAKTKSATHPVVMKPEKELFLFTFPEDVIIIITTTTTKQHTHSTFSYILFFFTV